MPPPLPPPVATLQCPMQPHKQHQLLQQSYQLKAAERWSVRAGIHMPPITPPPRCLPAVSHAAPQTASTAAAAVPAKKRLNDALFEPGSTVSYNPLQKKVEVEALMDTRLRGNTLGSLGNPNLVQPAGNQGQIRSARTDGRGQVRFVGGGGARGGGRGGEKQKSSWPGFCAGGVGLLGNPNLVQPVGDQGQNRSVRTDGRGHVFPFEGAMAEGGAWCGSVGERCSWLGCQERGGEG